MRLVGGSGRLVAAVLVALAGFVAQGEALDATPGYAAIQRAFIREDFVAVTTLAPTFLSDHPEVPETPRVWVWLALSLDRLQRSNEALNELDRLKGRLRTDDALWPEVLFWEGDVSRRAFQMIRAKLAYQRLLERHPRSIWASQAQMGLGLVYLHQQAFEVALGYFHEVALRQASEPVALDALLFEGLCNVRLERHKEAVAILGPLVDRLREPSLVAQAAFYLGESLAGLKLSGDAIRAYQRVIAAQPSSQWAQLAEFGLGWIYYQSGQCEGSIQAFERFLGQRQAPPSIQPLSPSASAADHHLEALFAQAGCLLQLGREREALTGFQRVMERNPRHPLAFESGLVLADAYRRGEQFTQAKALLHAFLTPELDAVSRAKIQLRLGAIALEQGNAVQAKTLLELARSIEDPAVRQESSARLGDVQMFLGDWAGAKQWYAQAIAMSEPSALGMYATYQLGRIRLQLGAVNDAIALFQRVANDADSALADEAKLALVLAYLNQGEARVARSLLEAIRDQRPKSHIAARSAYYLALIALGENDGEMARARCQETMARAPRSEEAVDARLLLAEMLAQRTSVRNAMGWLADAYASASLPVRHRAKLAKRLGDFARTERLYAQAIRWYERAAGLLPSLSPEVTYRTASCYEEAGDRELAMRWYQAIVQPPWRVRGQLALGKLLEREDRTREAEAIYERLAEEPIPEAEVIRERLAALRGSVTDKE